MRSIQRGSISSPNASAPASCAACSGVIRQPERPQPSLPTPKRSSAGSSTVPDAWPGAGSWVQPKREMVSSSTWAPTECTASCAKHWLFEVASACRSVTTFPERGGSMREGVSRYGLPL